VVLELLKLPLNGEMATLRAEDLMGTALDAVSPDASLHDALKIMNRTGDLQLPVVKDGELVGIITDRDLRLAMNSPFAQTDTPTRTATFSRKKANLKREAILDDIQVDQCMAPDPQCVSSDTPAHEVADLLSLNKFGAMPVVDEDKLVGMISGIDFLKHFAANP